MRLSTEPSSHTACSPSTRWAALRHRGVNLHACRLQVKSPHHTTAHSNAMHAMKGGRVLPYVVAACHPFVAGLCHAVLLRMMVSAAVGCVQVPLPHVSLAWAPGEQASRLQPWLDSVEHEPIQLKVGGSGGVCVEANVHLHTTLSAAPYDSGTCICVLAHSRTHAHTHAWLL